MSYDDRDIPTYDDFPPEDDRPPAPIDVFAVIEDADRRLSEVRNPKMSGADGARADMKRIELDLLDPEFIDACAHHPDIRSVRIAISALARDTFATAVRGIEAAIVKRYTKVTLDAEKERQREEAQRRAAFKRAAAEAEAAADWTDRVGPHPLVESTLARTKTGPRATTGNVLKALRDDPRWGNQIRVNRLGNVTELRGVPIKNELNTIQHATEWLADTYDLHVNSSLVRDALFACAELHEYHPVQEYLNGLPAWDGAQTIYSILPEILGIRLATNADAETKDRFNLYQTYMRRMLISAVARAMRPGCKVDTALIFVGKQGAQKSSFFRVIFGDDWFGDSAIQIGNKDAAIQLASTWGYEVAEMASLSKKTSEEVKQFLSQQDDLYRQIFERDARRKPRHSIMVGSTNKREFLTDDTGERRFWPIEVPDGNLIDLRKLRKMRDAIWSEALAAYQTAAAHIAADVDVPADVRWWFTQEARQADVARHVAGDVWDSVVSDWLETQKKTPRMKAWTPTTAEVLTGAVGVANERMGPSEERRMSAILKRMGWRKKRQQITDGYRDVWTEEVAKPRTVAAPVVQEREEPPDPTDDDYVVMDADGVPY